MLVGKKVFSKNLTAVILVFQIFFCNFVGGKDEN